MLALLLTVTPLSGRLLSELTLPVLLPLLLLPPRVMAPLPVRDPLLGRLVEVLGALGRFTWLLLLGVAIVVRLVLELLRLTCGVAVAVRLVLELLRLICGVAVAVRLVLELLRLICGAVEWLLERETAADWLLLLVLPPCERLRPWAEASDAPIIRHPMSAKLIIIFVTEVFIIVDVLMVQQSFFFLCLLDGKPRAKFNTIIHDRPDKSPYRA